MWDFLNIQNKSKVSVEGHVGGYIALYPEAKYPDMDLYSGILGSYLGNLALQTLPTGGLWICGGVTQNVPLLECEYSL